MSLYDIYRKSTSVEGLAQQLAESIREHFEKKIEEETKKIEILLKKQERVLRASASSLDSAARKALKQINNLLP